MDPFLLATVPLETKLPTTLKTCHRVFFIRSVVEEPFVRPLPNWMATATENTWHHALAPCHHHPEPAVKFTGLQAKSATECCKNLLQIFITPSHGQKVGNHHKPSFFGLCYKYIYIYVYISLCIYNIIMINNKNSNNQWDYTFHK